MPVELFYPYRTAADTILMYLDIPGMERSGNDESLLVYQCSGSKIELRVSAIVSEEIWETVFSDSERKKTPAKLWLVTQSIESRSRQAFELTGDGEVYGATIRLKLSDWAGKAEFQAVLVRTTKNNRLPSGYARDPGTRLAWSKTHQVWFKEPVVPQRDVLQIQWRKFQDNQKSQLFSLDYSEPQPKLYLNSEVEGLYEVLNSRALRGLNPAIAENTSYLIAHQVLTSLLATAISHLAETGEADGLPDMAELLEWERTILEDWVEALFPGMQRSDATNHMLTSVRQHYFREELLMRRIPESIQERLGTFRGFEHLVKEAGR
jgi:hypothetical protein